MNKSLKRIVIIIVVIIVIALLIYGGYQLYNYILEIVFNKARAGAAKGVGDAVNPLKWPAKLFGR